MGPGKWSDGKRVYIPRGYVRASPTGLTRREKEVLQQVALGQTNKQIAEGLCMALKTVEYHVHHILGKLGVKTRTQAAMKALRLGIVEVGTDTEGNDD